MAKRGTAAVLAMIFLVIFGALSFAFYAVINTSIAVAKNDRDAHRARAAAESGMEYVKHVVSWTKIGSTVPESQHLDEVQATIKAVVPGSEYSGRIISFPNMSLQTGEHSFSATITEDTSFTPRMLAVNVTGVDGVSGLTRTISALFEPRNLGDGAFRYSGASRGLIKLESVTVSGGKGLMTTSLSSPAMILNNAVLNDTLAVTVSEGQVYQTGSDYDVSVVAPPTFADFNTLQYKPYATTPYSVAKNLSLWRNVLVRASDISGSNKVLKITGNTTIQGVLYLEPGISIDVTGNPTLNGLIVCETSATKPTNFAMSGNFLVQKSTIGMAAGLIPLAEGLTIVAPTTTISLTGSSTLTAEGSIICSRFVATSSGGGSQAITITNGTLLTLYDSDADPLHAPAMYVSNRNMTFIINSNYKLPTAALLYKKQYVMAADSYVEQ